MVGQAIKRHRQGRMSARELADRCEQLGHRVETQVIANMEAGRRTNVSVAEVLVLARALEVAPALLLFPVGADEPTPVLPDQTLDPWTAYRWFIGEAALTEEAWQTRARNYLEGADRIEVYRRHDQALVRYQAFRESGPPGTADAWLFSLVQAREDIRRNGWHLLPIPADIAAEVSAGEAQYKHRWELAEQDQP